MTAFFLHLVGIKILAYRSISCEDFIAQFKNMPISSAPFWIALGTVFQGSTKSGKYRIYVEV
jgi:hypothetical protein